MDTQKIFEILDITVTKDENLIREAYRNKLVTVNPEDNPEGFRRLREAYEAALKYAAQSEETGKEKNNDPVSLYIEKLTNIYHSLSRRLDTAEWESLLKDEILDDLDLSEDAKWSLFRFLSGNYRLPTRIWHLLDRTFHIQEEQQRFKEHLPVNFVDFILWSCSEEAELSEFPYDQLNGSDTADYDEFLQHLNALTSLVNRESEYQDRTQWLKEQEQKIAFLDTLCISHSYFELEKARFAMAEGRTENALQAADALLTPGTEDALLLLGCARIYKNCGQEDKAEQIYRAFLEHDKSDDQEQAKAKHRHNNGDIYTSFMALADILFSRKDYVQARKYVLEAIDLYHTQEAIQLLTDTSNAVIEQMTGEMAPKNLLSVDDGLELADCYVKTDRAAEGVAYFEQHPVLTEDTVKCHRTKAILYNSAARYEESLAETLMWRRNLEDDPEASSAQFVQNYVLEAKAHEEIYRSFADKQSQAALSHKEAAFAAFEEAFRLIPEDIGIQINVRVNKVLLLRTMWEDDPSKDYYQQAAALCEEIKELDRGYYWAYHYAQEAYEKLGNAQKVVDNFYDAKRIYAGMPEIYERAARVFQSYEQWNDLGGILKQAEESGIESDCLKVINMELKRVEAKSKQEVWQAEVYCKHTIDALEEKLEKESLPEKELHQLKRTLAEAYRQRALLHDDNGKIKGFKSLDDIENWMKRAVELFDTYSNRYFLGYFYLYEKVDHKEAYRHLKVCEEKGTSHWVFRRIALCHEHWSQWDDAIKYYKKGADLAPDNDDYLWRIGWLYRQKFNRTGQMEYYEEALRYLDLQMERFGEHHRKDWEIWWQYSDLHTRNSEYEKALAEIEKELAVNGRGRNWGHKADLLELLGRSQEAFATFEKSVNISRKNNADYAYGYTQIYRYFCRCHAYDEGIAWFEARMDQLLTEEQRKKNLGRILNFYLMLANWQNALKTLEEMYGGITLKECVCTSWKEEGDRIDDLLDAYQYWLPNEELLQKAEEAAALLERTEGLKTEGDPETEEIIHEGKRMAYVQVAYCYSDYLFDDETGLFYFQKALEHAKLAGDETDYDDYRSVIHNIMGCLWRLGRTQEAGQYRTLFMDSLAKEFEECAELGKSVETLYEQSRYSRYNSYYLFKLDLFCGDYEKAAERLKHMECSRWCWNCREKECTDAWEVKGYLALVNGQKEEAYRCFKKANACALTRNDEAYREMRRLCRESDFKTEDESDAQGSGN